MKVRYSTTPNGEKRTDQELEQQWNSINWNEIKSPINRLQTRIAKATQERKWNLVKRRRIQTRLSFFFVPPPTNGL
ncbi:MAG: reverse transcriptase N-terminal domain-containing protein [Methanomicrobiales archaeon]